MIKYNIKISLSLSLSLCIYIYIYISGLPWHGTDPRARTRMARHGTEIPGTARQARARHGVF